jgi:two-component system response regulator MprA
MSERRRILVVDDDSTLRETLAEILIEDGFDVRGASNGRAALDQLHKWPADLVILDLMMPVMDAYSFQTSLRADGHRTPILVVSAAPKLDEAATRLEAVGVVAKPFRIGELRDEVNRALEGDSGGEGGRRGGATASAGMI